MLLGPGQAVGKFTLSGSLLQVKPPEHALVPSVDEKSQIRALNRTRPELPTGAGTACNRAGRRHDA
jgi:hypothetical protein